MNLDQYGRSSSFPELLGGYPGIPQFSSEPCFFFWNEGTFLCGELMLTQRKRKHWYLQVRGVGTRKHFAEASRYVSKSGISFWGLRCRSLEMLRVCKCGMNLTAWAFFTQGPSRIPAKALAEALAETNHVPPTPPLHVSLKALGYWKLSASRCAIGTQLDAGAQREMLWRCTVALLREKLVGRNSENEKLQLKTVGKLTWNHEGHSKSHGGFLQGNEWTFLMGTKFSVTPFWVWCLNFVDIVQCLRDWACKKTVMNKCAESTTPRFVQKEVFIVLDGIHRLRWLRIHIACILC